MLDVTVQHRGLANENLECAVSPVHSGPQPKRIMGGGRAQGAGGGDKECAGDVCQLNADSRCIDLTGAQDVTNVTAPAGKKIDLSGCAVPKTEFLDIVAKLTAAGIDPSSFLSRSKGWPMDRTSSSTGN